VAADPHVSCLMPTRDRRAFIPQAVARFLAQDYVDKELVVVDDGADPIDDLLPADPRITYVHLAEPTILGTKRNLAAETACGDVLVHWDDDDWSAAHRLTAQVAALDGADVSGLNCQIWRRVDGRAWRHTWLGRRPWLAGNTLAYWRHTWQRVPFRAMATGEDTAFVWAPGPRVLRPIEDESLVIGTIHPGNTSRKTTRGREWQPLPADQVRRIMAADDEETACATRR
jgi:glycosyltransferase involved in cell wall biosynthesis